MSEPHARAALVSSHWRACIWCRLDVGCRQRCSSSRAVGGEEEGRQQGSRGDTFERDSGHFSSGVPEEQWSLNLGRIDLVDELHPSVFD